VLRRVIPRLWFDHPSLFISFFSTAMLHLAVGFQQVAWPENYIGPAFYRITDLASIQTWGWLSLVVWLLITIGVYADVWVARIGLIIGMMLCVTRAVLLGVAGVPVGSGVPVYLFLAAIHFAQVREPEINPVTRKS
jgi:hypothetical protein